MISNIFWLDFACLNHLRLEFNMNLITMGFAQNLSSWKRALFCVNGIDYIILKWLRVLSDFIIAICVNLLLIWFKWSSHLKRNKINFIIFWKDVLIALFGPNLRKRFFYCTFFYLYYLNHFLRGKFRLNYCYEYK